MTAHSIAQNQNSSSSRKQSGIIQNATHDIHDTQDIQDTQRESKNNKRVLPLENDLSSSLCKLRDSPLSEYLEGVIPYTEQLREGDVYPEHHSKMFHFARFCKAHPSLIDLQGEEAFRQVDKELHALVGETDFPFRSSPWTSIFSGVEDEEDAAIDFQLCWAKVKHIPFVDILQSAWIQAKENPIAPPLDRTPRYADFIGLAYWLQRLTGDQPILLPVRKVSQVLECDPATVSRMRQLAMLDKVLCIVRRGTFHPGRKSNADEFKFTYEPLGMEASGR